MPDVIVSDDLHLAYREQGSGPPLLLVHGWAAHGGFFQPQLDGLSDCFRVISVDLRGHGRSRDGAGDITIASMSADLEDFLRRLELDEVTAVGWSMGAMVLWEVCLGAEAWRIARLVVEDMSPRIVNDAAWSLGLRGGYELSACEDSMRLMRRDWAAYAAILTRNMFASGEDRSDLAAFAEREFEDQDAETMARLWGEIAGQDFRSRLSRITVPTLVAHGSHGLYPAATARHLKSVLPHASSIEFEHSGHAPHLEEPELFNRTVAEFATQPKSARPSAAATIKQAATRGRP